MSGRPPSLPDRPVASNAFAGRPDLIAERPVTLMDAFSAVLNGVKLTGAVFFRAEFSAPWGLSSGEPAAMAAKVAPGAQHLVLYHLLIDGSAAIEMNDGTSITLGPGDVVVFPHAAPHQMCGARGMPRPFPNYGITAKIVSRDLTPLHAGGGGAISRFVCGYLTCDPDLCRPILEGLPPVFAVNIRTDSAGHWLESSIMHLVEEAASGRVGSEAMLAKLSEALFVDTLRRYVATLPEQQAGWLTAARDPVVGKALALIHGRVADAWTIADLAEAVGISRSSLVERFTKFLAVPPMTYLTRWRLQLASKSLERTPRSVADIAGSVGYESEAAFSRAFKREFGQAPGQYRDAFRNRSTAEPPVAAGD